MDDADRASELEELTLTALRSNMVTPKHLDPCGVCYNCSQMVMPSQIYCDDECAADHTWYMKRKAQ